MDSLILKNILLREIDEEDAEKEEDQSQSPFEKDPMGFILKKYVTLNELLTELMTPSFKEYLDAIFIVAPKPTTFKILLHNGQYFFLTYLEKAYQATISGKNYYLMTTGEKQLCMQAIARLLRFGSPLKTKGPEGSEQGPEASDEGETPEAGEETAAPEAEAGGEEETLAEARILSEILKKIVLSEATVNMSRPNIGNETSLKEGLVCLFYDVFKDSSLVKDIEELHAVITTKQAAEQIIEEDIKKVTDKISQVYNKNKQYYGAGKSMPENLDLFVKYVFLKRDPKDIVTLTNSIASAAAIHKQISADGRIIRDQKFENIRSKAVLLIKEQYNISLEPDNWCPGDVYLVLNESSIKACLEAKTLNIGKSSLNHQFEKSGEIIAISLKEETARGGKATTFASTVFTNTFESDVKQEDKYGTSDNKALAQLSAKITRFQDYYYGKDKKRKKSNINAITKNEKLHSSINSILIAGGKQTTSTKKIVPNYKSEEEFLKANQNLFNDILDSISIIKKSLTSEESSKKIEDTFVNSRNTFISNIKKYKVEIEAEDSKTFVKEIKEKSKDYIKALSMKTSTYELASLIIGKWTDKNAKISPAYKKIQDITNPFVALTAFAIAEAGISPSFYKVIGSAKSLMGHADYFSAKAEVDIDSTSSKMKLVDSAGNAGFILDYVTILGNKKYDTKLAFVFSNTSIKIEVQELKAQ
jgi:hypothetical protein